MNDIDRVSGHGVGAAARTLSRAFAGPLYLPGEDAYDVARLAWRRTIDPRPAIVVEATGSADVRAAILAACEIDLQFAVQATGHGTVLPADGGLLLKTSRMTTVEVDPEWRVARVGPGTLWHEVIAAAAPFGLAPLSGSSEWVGVTGYSLGGGTGWLSRKYGFAADSLLRAEVVTADGELLTASAGENPDLFWALRGGGNFGVATELAFRLYPVDRVYAGMAFFGIERAAETLAHYREWAAGEPDELNTAVMLMQMPAAAPVPEPVRGKRVLAIRVFAVGEAEEVTRQIQPLLDAAGPPLLNGFRSMSFAEASGALSGPPPLPMAARQHFDLFRELPDDVLDTLLAAGEGSDSPLAAIEIRHWGGAMARPAPDSGPVGHRDMPFSVIATDPQERDRIDASVDNFAARLRPHATGGSFLNFLADPAQTATAYTADDYRRLATLKTTYDPDNVFHLNHNIPPDRAARGGASASPRYEGRGPRVESVFAGSERVRHADH